MGIILVIEDQSSRYYSIIERFKRILFEKESKYKIEVEDNWRVALEYFNENKNDIELVLLDVMMPVIHQNDLILSKDRKISAKHGIGRSASDFEFGTYTGCHVYKQMKKENKDIKIIFWTVLKKEEIEKRGISIEENEYIEKSSDYLTFYDVIDNILNTNYSEYAANKLTYI